MEVVVEGGSITASSKKILDNSTTFMELIKQFDTIIGNINTAWEGDDALKYINTMKEKYIVEMLKLQAILNSYGTYLSKVPGVYDTLDETFLSKTIDV